MKDRPAPETDSPDRPRPLLPTNCLFCSEPDDRLLIPARLRRESFSPEAFTARRGRLVKENYRTVICRRCGLVRADPVLPLEQIDALYRQSHYAYAAEDPFAAETYAALLERLRQSHSSLAGLHSLVEIGCGAGMFLDRARQLSGIEQVLGFEPSREACRHAPAPIRDRIIESVFDVARLEGRRFDLACSFHVIDHLASPLTFLGDLASALNPGGHLLLVCHDVAAWSARLLGRHSPIFDVEHVHLFSRKTLGMLIERAGFETVAIGGLANRYPLGYWLRMLHFLEPAAALLPERIRRTPVRLRAGNIYILGRLAG